VGVEKGGGELTWWRWDPWTYALAAAALTVYVLHGFGGFLMRDIAIYGYAGQQVVEGSPPYIGILSRTGPLAHLLPALGVAAARVGGFDDLLGMRLVFMVFSIACVCLAYVLARDTFGSRLAGLAAASAFLSFHGFTQLATYGPREKTPMVLFLLCALLAISRRKWFLAGVCVSLATLVWQPAILVGGTALVAASIAVPGAERRAVLARATVGGIAPATICVAYFAIVGAFREFVDGYLLINARYTVPSPLLRRFSDIWPRLQENYGVSLWVIVAGLVALIGLTFVAIGRGRGTARFGDPVVVVGAAGLAALAWSLRDFNGWPDAFILLPMAAVGIGGVAQAVVKRLPRRAGLSVVLAAVAGGVAVGATFSVSHRDDGLQLQRTYVDALLAQLPADASMMSIGAPQPLVLSRRTNPTRYQTFTRGLEEYMEDTWPGGLRGFAEWVRELQPTILSLDARRVPEWLRELVREEYRRVARVTGWTWFAHRSVDVRIEAPT